MILDWNNLLRSLDVISTIPRWADPAADAARLRTIYARGEMGIRHEDTVAVTGDGCENLVPKWSGTPEEPAVV